MHAQRTDFQYRDLRPDDPYRSNWREMKHRAIISVISLLALVPQLLACTTILGVLGVKRPGDNGWFFLCAFVAALPFWISRVWLAYSPCPRCGQAFFGGFWTYYHNARACYHCRLPRYAPADPQSETPV
jgi:hypothetical protein